MAQKTVLITGAEGFTGKYVAETLVRTGYGVTAWSHGVSGRAGVSVIDLTDRSAVRRELRDLAPDFVIHLAAISFVAHGEIEDIYRTNVIGTRNLLEGLSLLHKRPSRVLIASSANVYGNREGVVDESSVLSPQNDYAVSKMAMEYMSKLWSDSFPITIARPFNYSGVGQSEKFLIPKIVSHFKRGERVIELGNIDVSRDFNDVRSVAEIYSQLMLGQDRWEVFNICTGQEYSLRQIISAMEQIAGYKMEVRVNPDFVRTNEVRRLIGDPNLLARKLGGLPGFSMDGMLKWMYEA
ncbi:GDP-mannose 4,6-dehydratase [Pseudoxanthomonas sacheonensis]|uniref:Nucleoside-diphosphate-sugar epimerase n=1 Tax=Pseudoxanthomonas sacheonensis TaxID=443615 RepID=A0ABU1RVY2_9GAMM|nr:GDP-mannose 4,6-dehydratase [Pseudoxanthomonas sacheonensis]MDR6842920.1 nucleoside-diphosphate-sugar epimerase [Pseudoxanthomonas sacheonensis]